MSGTWKISLLPGLPMIVNEPIRGQEERNADFLLEQGAALKACDPATLECRVRYLFRNPDKLADMKAKDAALARRGFTRPGTGDRKGAGLRKIHGEELKFEIRRAAIMLGWLILLAYFFAHTEIEIEGPARWVANLPTWRIEKHWLLDIFWGGRAMTGYHAWMFPFIALFFHFPMFFSTRFSWHAEARIIACLMLFRIVEDFPWFVINPAFGMARFHPGGIPGHKRWLWGASVDYWMYSVIMMLLL